MYPAAARFRAESESLRTINRPAPFSSLSWIIFAFLFEYFCLNIWLECKHKLSLILGWQSAGEQRLSLSLLQASNEELQQRIRAQFEQVVQRLRKKEAEVMGEVDKLRQKRVNLIHGLQNQQETAWGQIDAVLKTPDDAKMLEVRGTILR